jgi:hypothetical protein
MQAPPLRFAPVGMTAVVYLQLRYCRDDGITGMTKGAHFIVRCGFLACCLDVYWGAT